MPWGYLTAGAGSVALVFLVIFCFSSRGRLVVATTGLAVLATAALGTAMVSIPRNTKPAEAKTDLAYGNDRGELALGTCEVSIPKDHEVGELESPSIFKLEFNEDPTQARRPAGHRAPGDRRVLRGTEESRRPEPAARRPSSSSTATT